MLIDRSWTDEEYRSLEQMYQRKVDEAERLMAMLEEVSQAVGPVWSPSIGLTGMAEACGWLPHTPYYDQQGAAGMVFVAAVFEHREIATRFEACRKRLDVVAKRHNNQDGKDTDDPAFPIIRHLKNNWWGRNPVVNVSWPNKTANALMAKYPAQPDPKAEKDPAMLVHDGKVYVRTGFRQHTGDNARGLGTHSAYIEDAGGTIVSEASTVPHELPFTIESWFDQPDNVKGTDGQWYLVAIGRQVEAA